MSKEAIHIRMEVLAHVELPDATVDDGSGTPTAQARQRAIEAIIGAIPQTCEVYIDGENAKPAKVFIEVSEDYPEQWEVWVE